MPAKLYPIAMSVLMYLSSIYSTRVTIAADIVVDFLDTPRKNELVQLDIISLRPITDVIEANRFGIESLNIPKDVLAKSAIAIPELREQFSSSKPAEQYSWENIGEVYSYLSSPSGAHLLEIIGANSTKSLVKQGLVDTDTVLSNPIGGVAAVAWDPVGVINLAGHGIFSLRNSPRWDSATDESINFVTIETEYRVPVLGAFRAYKDGVKQASLATAAEQFDHSVQYVRNYDSLEKALLEKLGRLSFGAPIIYTSSEKNFVLPASITRSFDVIWAEFPVTLLLMEPVGLNEIYVELRLPDGYRVLDLLPLTIGVESDITDKLATPEIKIPSPAGEILVGEIFSRTIAVKNIKPIVIGAGLGLDWFSWQMSKEAARSGSHKFIAIIAVPKGTKEFEVSASSHIRIQRTAQSFLLGYGDLAGTGVGLVPVSY
jgi:hypothetical protein